MSATISRELPIAITFTAGQWEMVMQAMGHGPYNIVRPLIEEMQRQCWRYAQRDVPQWQQGVNRTNGEHTTEGTSP
jgi:hypothetical protein